MVNIINTLTEKNKQLLAKIEELKNKNNFQELIAKVREWTGEKEGGSYTSYDLAEYYLVDENGSLHYGYRREVVDKLDTLEYVKSLIRATKRFNRDYWNLMSEKGKVENEKNKLEEDFREKVVKISKLEEKIKNLETKQKEQEAFIEKQTGELEFEKESANCHLDAVGVCEDWYVEQIENLKEESQEKSELLEKERKNVAELRKQKGEATDELWENTGLLRQERENVVKQKAENQELKSQLYLLTKPLPKRPSKFKILKENIKTKFQQLVKREKHQEQELVAKIETPVK